LEAPEPVERAGGGAGGVPGGGYITTGNWHGYAWTTAVGTGSSIMPIDFSMLAAGQPLCVQGVVGPDVDYGGVGILGVNLNQEMGTMTPVNTVTPGQAGLAIAVTNNAGSNLRVQIQGPAGETDANDRWCQNITGNGGYFEYTGFTTECWSTTAPGTAYANQPIVAVMVLVPGDNMVEIPFDFCLTGLGEGMTATPIGTGGAGGSGGDGGSGTITERYGRRNVIKGGRNYIIQNNVWGSETAMQTLSFSSTAFSITQQTGNNAGQAAPVSYPSTWIGANGGGMTEGSNLPKPVASLGPVMTTWSINASAPGSYNAAYDVWFSATAAGDDASTGAPSGGYLMVWFRDPPDAQPVGGNTNNNANLAGQSWQVWTGSFNGRSVISYVATTPLSTLTFDLNTFIQDAVGRNQVQTGWALTNVFAGFEVWSGGVGLATTDFSVVVN
jgi:hypothetical protein